MGKKHYLLLGLIALAVYSTAWAQSPAALQKVQAKYSPVQLDEIQQQTHYKYEGLLLFYSSSFLVMENGQARAATESEIGLVDLDQYNGLRQEKAPVSVHDAAIGRDIVLLSRHDFEAVVLAHLSEADRADYQAYKAAALAAASKSNQ